MVCNACGATYTTEAQRQAHLSTAKHLKAARNMWREFLEHPTRKTKLSSRVLNEAQASLAEIERQLAALNQKEG
jgi:hypothetical protein